MGALLSPHFDRRVPRTGFDDEGKFLLAEIEGLDKLASQHEVRPLSSFFDEREFRVWQEGSLEETEDEYDAWHDAKEAAESVQRLLDALTHYDWKGETYDKPELLDALRSLQEQLAAAVTAGARFRFEVIP